MAGAGVALRKRNALGVSASIADAPASFASVFKSGVATSRPWMTRFMRAQCGEPGSGRLYRSFLAGRREQAGQFADVGENSVRVAEIGARSERARNDDAAKARSKRRGKATGGVFDRNAFGGTEPRFGNARQIRLGVGF